MSNPTTAATPTATTAASRPPRPGLEADAQHADWSRAHRAEIQMRYGDLDTMGHLNNSVYVQYFETARVLLWRDLRLSSTGVGEDENKSVIARVELDYRHEVRFGQTVVIETLVERLGTSSWTLLARLLADDRPCALNRTIQVRVDNNLRPVALSDRQREKLLEMLVQPA